MSLNKDNAPKDAAKIQAATSDQALAEMARQFNISTAQMQPFIDSGMGFGADVQQGASAGGLDARLGEIFNSGTFANLQDERTKAVQQQLSQNGLNRSGYGAQAAAAIPTDLAMAIEEMLYGRQASMYGNSQNAAAGQGTAGNNYAANVAGVLQNKGDALAQGVIGQAQARAGQFEQGLNTATSVASMFFSDPRLKENMEPLGEIAGLTIYEWDWREGVTDLVGKMSLGFDADQVQEKYPEFIQEVCGFKAVNYLGLIDHLREDLREAA